MMKVGDRIKVKHNSPLHIFMNRYKRISIEGVITLISNNEVYLNLDVMNYVVKVRAWEIEPA